MSFRGPLHCNGTKLDSHEERKASPRQLDGLWDMGHLIDTVSAQHLTKQRIQLGLLWVVPVVYKASKTFVASSSMDVSCSLTLLSSS